MSARKSSNLTYANNAFVSGHITAFMLMNRNEIGVNAGKVWQLLSNNEKWSYGLLKRKSGLKDKELGAALGWLSRENKIEFDQCDEELYVYLCVNVYIG